MNADKNPQQNTPNLATYLEDAYAVTRSGFYSQNGRMIQHTKS